MADQDLNSAELLHKLLDYDPETGVLTWRARAPETSPTSDEQTRRRWNTRYAGKVAGYSSCYGYREITIYDKHHRVHRLIWLYMTGVWPTDQIDHIDGDRSNNRWANLREATASQNHANRKRKPGKKFPKGVTFHRRDKRWQAQIQYEGKIRHIGRFDTVEEAAAAYAAKARELYGEFARTG